MEKHEDIREVEKVITELSALNNIKMYCKDDPFLPSESDITELQETLTAMLENYMRFLAEFNEGNLMFIMEGAKVQANPSSSRSGKNAIAYKSDIDTELICKLFKGGLSFNQIGKQVGCSPDTVKRRIFDIQHGMEDR